MAVLDRAQAPLSAEGSSWCSTRPSTPGFYALPKGELAHPWDRVGSAADVGRVSLVG